MQKYNEEELKFIKDNLKTYKTTYKTKGKLLEAFNNKFNRDIKYWSFKADTNAILKGVYCNKYCKPITQEEIDYIQVISCYDNKTATKMFNKKFHRDISKERMSDLMYHENKNKEARPDALCCRLMKDFYNKDNKEIIETMKLVSKLLNLIPKKYKYYVVENLIKSEFYVSKELGGRV